MIVRKKNDMFNNSDLYSAPSVSVIDVDLESMLCQSPNYGDVQEPGSGSDWDNDFII